MSWPSLTYTDYQGLGGAATGGAFAASLPWAERRVRAWCWPNEPQTDEQQYAAKAAMAAAIDVDAAWGGSHGAGSTGSVSIGGFSASGDAQHSGFESDLSRALSDALAGSGLTCRVVL
jgi:hypothetical protein